MLLNTAGLELFDVEVANMEKIGRICFRPKALRDLAKKIEEYRERKNWKGLVQVPIFTVVLDEQRTVIVLGDETTKWKCVPDPTLEVHSGKAGVQVR